MYVFRPLGATMLFALVLFAPFDATRSPATAATKPLVAGAACLDFVTCLRNRLDPRSTAASRRAAPGVALRSALARERNVTVLHAWTGGRDGRFPWGTPVAFGGAGYGVTLFGGEFSCRGDGCGTIFKLTPPAPGKTAWTHSIIHAFDGVGGDSPNGLIVDSAGALYGSTFRGGGDCDCGTVFRLTPPAIGATTWTYSVLHTFTEADGQYPSAGLVFDKTGALYGTTGTYTTQGTVFKLMPPTSGGTWTLSTIHHFVGRSDGYYPNSDLIIDGNGALYGTTYGGGGRGCVASGCGTVFKLTQPASGRTAWTENLLYAFSDADVQIPKGLTADRSGALYVTTMYGGVRNCGGGTNTCGSVVKLTAPPSGIGRWNAKVLHLFAGYPTDGGQPNAPVIVDSTGALYGTTPIGGTYDRGTVFKVTPPSRNSGLWTEQTLHSFKGGADAAYPFSKLLDVGFRLYGQSAGGGFASDACPYYDCGAAFVLGK